MPRCTELVIRDLTGVLDLSPSALKGGNGMDSGCGTVTPVWGDMMRNSHINQKISSAIRISSSVKGRHKEDVVVRLQGVGGLSLEFPVCIIDEY